MTTSPTRHLSSAALCLLLIGQSAAANEYSALMKDKKYAEVEQAVNAKLAAEPNNAEALVTKVEVMLILTPDSKLDQAAKLAEQCIAVHPQNSECQEALGNALGQKAMMGGIMSAIGYATKIRDAFKKAVELEPKNLSARFSLLQYYQQAPGIVGGGSGKAQALATDTAKINAEAGKLMQALVDLADDQYAKAEAEALAVNPAGTETLVGQQRDALVGLGASYMKEKKYADSERVFREVQKRFPASGSGYYGVARVLQEQAKHQDALALFEKSLAIEPYAHIYYRMGQCLKALNDKTRATAAFEKALAFKPGLMGRQKSDAEDQLKALKG